MAGRPLYILIWDGAAPWLVDRALADGALPNLQRLRSMGCGVTGSTTDAPDCTTPPSHAVLWTGFSARFNGVASYKVPAQPPEAHTVLDVASGFDARLLLKEPIWVTAARAGLTTTLVHAPLSSPISVWGAGGAFEVPPGTLKIVHGWGRPLVHDWMVRDPETRPPSGWRGLPGPLDGALEFTVRSEAPVLHGLLLRGPTGFDRTWICLDKAKAEAGVAVPAGPGVGFSEPLSLGGAATVAFRLFELAPDGKKLRLFGSSASDVEALPAELGPAYLKELGPFRGCGAYRWYGEGALGPLYEDGAAETRYMETHRFGMAHCRRSFRYALERYPADLMVFYYPGPDELGHEWAGFVEAEEAGYDPARERVVWPHFRDAYHAADEVLGDLLDALPPEGTLMLLSDHGVSGVQKQFNPNVVLRDRGFLKVGLKGQPVVEGTRAVYHPSNNGYVFLNGKPFRGGEVRDEQRDELLESVRDALMAYDDPATGKPPLAAAIRVSNLPPDTDYAGQGRGDLFLAVKRGYCLSDDVAASAVGPCPMAGHHQQSPGVRHLHGIFECTGPGVRRGARLGVVSHKDVHETFRRQLGLPPSGGGGSALTGLYEPEGPPRDR